LTVMEYKNLDPKEMEGRTPSKRRKGERGERG
jgi:hypothetical protein